MHVKVIMQSKLQKQVLKISEKFKTQMVMKLMLMSGKLGLLGASVNDLATG